MFGGPLSSSGHLGVKDGGKEGGRIRERGDRERRKRDEEKRQHKTTQNSHKGEEWQEMKELEKARGHKTERKRERQEE